LKNEKFVKIKPNGEKYGRKWEILEDWKVKLCCWRFRHENR